jgi:two-component system cell cycle sensor histidine kinase/response regulator CckA
VKGKHQKHHNVPITRELGGSDVGKKILVVDNHPVMLKFMADLLEKEKHHVVTAENGLAALDILNTFTPDVVFIDLIMPHISGEKLCEIIRSMPKLKDTYIIILSAVAAEGKINTSAFGANACITKGPFNKMRQHILLALEKSDQRPSAFVPGEILGREDIFPRRITTELLSIKRHFEVILNSMAEGILEITPEGRMVYANPGAVSLINLPENKLLGSNFTDLLQEADRLIIKDYLRAMGIQPQIMTEEVSLTINSKEISLSFLPVEDQEHKTIILILNDLSERKRMEAQFLQAQKMEAIGNLAGGIAHDFNNLLTIIQGNASLMLLDVDSSHPHYEMLLSIVKQVQSGSRLTKQLLGYARKGKYDVRPFQLNQLVEETSKTFGRTRKEITIHRELADDLFPIEGDIGQIEQILMNLLVNAADAMPTGGDIFLRTINIPHGDMKGKLYNPKPGDYVLLTVTDTGIGMDPKTLERIFEPFFTTKELGRGTGLGLASVYGIVKGHGGYIDVESKELRGTTFKTYLPASSGEVYKIIEAPEHIIKGTGTILLVDDEKEVLEVAEKLLKAMGYHVLTAWEGREAIEVYRKHRETIDLVLLDIIMPDMKGGEVFDRLKEINPEVKILLSSGYSIDGEATRILQRGGKGFIQKPFDIEQLSQSIRAILWNNSV